MFSENISSLDSQLNQIKRLTAVADVAVYNYSEICFDILFSVSDSVNSVNCRT